MSRSGLDNLTQVPTSWSAMPIERTTFGVVLRVLVDLVDISQANQARLERVETLLFCAK